MANKNNVNRPRRSKSKARPRTKPTQIAKRASQSKTSTTATVLSAKKSRKLLRNKAYNAQRIIEEAEKAGGDVVMRDEAFSKKQEKVLKNQLANQEAKEKTEAEMDVSEDL